MGRDAEGGKVFLIAVGTEDGRGEGTHECPMQIALGKSDDVIQAALANGFVPHYSARADVLPSRLELRFHQHDCPRAGLEKRHTGWQDFGQRDERDICHQDIDGVGNERGVQVTRVDTLQRNHTRVVTQLFVELVVPDIHRINLGGTMLQEDIREAASRCAEVQGNDIGQFWMEGLNGGKEFPRTARDVLRRRRKREACGLVELLARLANWRAVRKQEFPFVNQPLRQTPRCAETLLYGKLVGTEFQG